MPEGFFRLTTGWEEVVRQEGWNQITIGWGIVLGVLILLLVRDWKWRHKP